MAAWLKRNQVYSEIKHWFDNPETINLWTDLRQGITNSQVESWNNHWADL